MRIKIEMPIIATHRQSHMVAFGLPMIIIVVEANVHALKSDAKSVR
ncbi:hypothetical protein [Acidiplasma cupricumulans]|nr:hypothetical protein [Acidiplasma cupricumulans]